MGRHLDRAPRPIPAESFEFRSGDAGGLRADPWVCPGSSGTQQLAAGGLPERINRAGTAETNYNQLDATPGPRSGEARGVLGTYSAQVREPERCAAWPLIARAPADAPQIHP